MVQGGFLIDGRSPYSPISCIFVYRDGLSQARPEKGQTIAI
jgi:hypothetical protein